MEEETNPLIAEISGMTNTSPEQITKYRETFDSKLKTHMEQQRDLADEFTGSSKTIDRLEINVLLRTRIARKFDEQAEYAYLKKASDVNTVISSEQKPKRFWNDPYKAAEARADGASTVRNEINQALYALAIHNLDLYAKTRTGLDKDVAAQNYEAYGLDDPLDYGCLTLRELEVLVHGDFDPSNQEQLLSLDDDFIDVLDNVEAAAIRKGDWSIIGDTIRTTPEAFRRIVNADKSDSGLTMFTMGIDGHYDVSADDLSSVGYTRLVDIDTGNPAVNDWLLDLNEDIGSKESTLRRILQEDVKFEVPGAVIEDGKVLPPRLVDREDHLWIHRAERDALEDYLMDGSKLGA